MTFVRVTTDIHCEKGSPTYRLYINEELFTERTFIYHGNYLTENFQVEAPPGMYQIRLETVGKGKISMKNTQIALGPAKVIDTRTFKIE